VCGLVCTVEIVDKSKGERKTPIIFLINELVNTLFILKNLGFTAFKA